MPKTIEELQRVLRLRHRSDAEALIKEDAVKEAASLYFNRCLSSGSTVLQLDWRDVQEYLDEKDVSCREGWSVRREVEEDCRNDPYDIKPHAAMFIIQILDFFVSEEGKVYDIPLDPEEVRCYKHHILDASLRIIDLLGFLVTRSRKTEKEAKRKVQEGGDGWF